MKLSFIGTAETFLLFVALVFGMLWINNPDGNYEPPLALITICLAVLEFYRRKQTLKDDYLNPSKSNSETEVNYNNELYISEIKVHEIVEEINSAPPFQKESVAKRYNGLGINWFGYLYTASPSYRDENKVTVQLTTKETLMDSYYIWFDIDLAKLPEIKVLKKGTGICLVGKIISASGEGLCVTVKPTEIKVANA